MEQHIIDLQQIIEKNYQHYSNQEFAEIQDITFIKNLDYDKKIQAIKIILSDPTVVDNVSILNMHLLIMGLQIIDQKELQENESIWANNLKEFADMAIDLREDVEKLAKNLFCCFVGVLKTFRTHLNEGLKIEKLSARNALLLESLSFLGMGNVIKKIKEPILLDEVPYCTFGESTLHTMCNHFNIMNFLTTPVDTQEE